MPNRRSSGRGRLVFSALGSYFAKWVYHGRNRAQSKLGGVAKLRSSDRPRGKEGEFRRGDFESERGSGQKSVSTELRRPKGYQEGLTMVRALARTTVYLIF